MRTRENFTLLAVLSLALPAFAGQVQTAKPEEVGFSSERLQRIHATMQRHIDAGDISGAVTIVARKGRVAHFEAHGLTDIEAKKAMPKDAIFRIYSMSKPIAGTALMMLIEEGKIRLNDPVSKFIPEFRGMKVAVAQEGGRGGGGRGAAPRYYTIPATREFTIKDLLTHVSGLASGTISSAEAGKKLDRKDTENLADFIPRLGATPLEFQPGSRWSYSPQYGFATVGRLVEIVSGMPFDKFLKARMFDPLGMKDTAFYPTDANFPRLAGVYTKSAQGLQKNPNPNTPLSKYFFSGGGGLSSTAEDYLQFGEMLLNGGQLNGKRLLSPQTVELMSSVHVPDTFPGRQPGRAFGLSMQVINDPIAAGFRVGKGSFGWDGALGTHFWVDPVEKIVGVMMVQTSNQEIMRDFENAIMQAIVD